MSFSVKKVLLISLLKLFLDNKWINGIVVKRRTSFGKAFENILETRRNDLKCLKQLSKLSIREFQTWRCALKKSIYELEYLSLQIPPLGEKKWDYAIDKAVGVEE
jgi:hypothetical protein